MHYWCILIGEYTSFLVDLVETATVDQLKEGIIAKNKVLKDLATRHLTLYRVELDESYDEKKRISELDQLYEHLNEYPALGAENPLSVYFDGSASPAKKYFTLVRVPEGKSMYCGGVVLMADGIDAQVQKQPQNTSENDRQLMMKKNMPRKKGKLPNNLRR